YVTLFDGVFRPVQGQEGAETAVEIINPKSIRIYNKRNGVLQQVVINTLSDDNNTINNEYIRMDKDGKITGVTHVTYIRRKKQRRSARPPSDPGRAMRGAGVRLEPDRRPGPRRDLELGHRDAAGTAAR